MSDSSMRSNLDRTYGNPFERTSSGGMIVNTSMSIMSREMISSGILATFFNHARMACFQ